MEREAEARWKGLRSNHQINDRVQVFGFARQQLGCLHSLRCLMVSHYSAVIGRRSQEVWQKDSCGNLGKKGKLKRRRRKEGGRGEERRVSQRVSHSSGASLPLLLTFG